MSMKQEEVKNPTLLSNKAKLLPFTHSEKKVCDRERKGRELFMKGEDNSTSNNKKA
jgi:hypothetical protein